MGERCIAIFEVLIRRRDDYDCIEFDALHSLFKIAKTIFAGKLKHRSCCFQRSRIDVNAGDHLKVARGFDLLDPISSACASPGDRYFNRHLYGLPSLTLKPAIMSLDRIKI